MFAGIAAKVKFCAAAPETMLKGWCLWWRKSVGMNFIGDDKRITVPISASAIRPPSAPPAGLQVAEEINRCIALYPCETLKVNPNAVHLSGRRR